MSRIMRNNQKGVLQTLVFAVPRIAYSRKAARPGGMREAIESAAPFARRVAGRVEFGVQVSQKSFFCFSRAGPRLPPCRPMFGAHK